MTGASGHEGRIPRGLARSVLPLALVVGGVYWLYRANRRGGDGFADYRDYADYSEFDFGPGPVEEEEHRGLRGMARGVADRTQARVGDLRRRAQSGLARGVQSRPLALAGIALAAGFLIGMWLPASAPERRLLGGTRDRLMDKAQQAARDATSRVREAVGLEQT